MAITNKTTINSISLPPIDLISERINVTSFDEKNNQCAFLETFQFKRDRELDNSIIIESG